MHSFLQYSISLRYISGSACWGASNTSRAKRWPTVVLFVFFTKFTQSNSISNRSCTSSFYFLITHQPNYWRNNNFSFKYCFEMCLIRKSYIGRLYEPYHGLYAAFQALAPSRCHPFFHTQQSNTWSVFWEPGDDHAKPSSSDVQSFTITSLVCL